ncbi:MAG: hypothetical protein L0Z62_13640 [Gemmataceae bacterium]|nr:hypothetical protein [Gemmataceae bacterium]
MSNRTHCLALVVVLIASLVLAQDPVRSGLTPGLRPGPYSALVSVGPQRGQQHCFICEAEDRPVVIVFARHLSEPLGKLANRIDKAVSEHKGAELRAWMTFLAEDHTALDAKVVQWARTHAVGNVPVAIFEDVGGPPSYRLARDADVTVLLSVRQRVVANFAFRAGELNEQRIAEVLKALPLILKK